jgi:uncharacterized Rossmann fold enzyme
MEYDEIAEELGLDREKDLKAADLLNDLIKGGNIKPLRLIRGRCVIVFGAGPSLSGDVEGIRSEGLHERCILIAADGAVKALLDRKLIPHIQVTDLDGDIDSIIKANKLGITTVVHSHGDNIEKLRDFIPALYDVIGTTQLKPFRRLYNFGGFTDGDRAVFLANYFKAGLIGLAGMDFGSEIGEYSGIYEREFKLRKLEIGKKLLEELAGRSETKLFNLTGRGEDLRGIPRISVKQFREMSSQMQGRISP